MSDKILSKITVGLFCIVIGFAAYLRLHPAFAGTFGYTYDVGRDLLSVADIVVHHHISLIGPTTGLPGIFYGPWWYWLLSLPFVVSRGNPVGIAAFMGIVGIASVLIGFFLGRKITNVLLGVVYASFLAFSQALIGTSIQIWNPNFAPVTLLLILVLFLQLFTFQKNQQRNVLFLLLGILAALTCDSFEIVYGGIQLIWVTIVLVYFFRKKNKASNYFFYILGIGIIEAPRLFFEMRHQWITLHSLQQSMRSGASASTSFVNHLTNVFLILLSKWDGSFVHIPYVLQLLLLGVVICLFVLVRKKFTPVEQFFLNIGGLYVLCYVFFLLLFPGQIWDHFVVGFPVIILLLVSIIVFRYICVYKRIVGITIALLFVFFCLELLQNIPSNTKPTDISFYENQLQIVETIYQKAQGRPFDYDVYTPPIHPYTYRYLFDYLGKKYYLPRSNAHLVFYIIEPDVSHPTLRQSWITTHNSLSTLVSVMEFPSQVILQTRKR